MDDYIWIFGRTIPTPNDNISKIALAQVTGIITALDYCNDFVSRDNFYFVIIRKISIEIFYDLITQPIDFFWSFESGDQYD